MLPVSHRSSRHAPGARRRLSRRLAAGTAALTLALAACGDDEPDADVDTEATGDISATTEEAATTDPATTDDTTSVPSTSETTADSTTTTTASTETTAAETTAPAPDATGPLCEELPQTGAGSAETLAEQTTAEAIASIPSLSMLASALEQSTTLSSALEGPRAVTVFAPVDAAFEQMDPAALEAVLADPAQRDQLLGQHIAAGRNTSEALGASEGAGLQNRAGSQLTFAAEGDTLTVNDQATVGCADLRTSNGVIHLVDMVLQPPAEGTTETTAPA